MAIRIRPKVNERHLEQDAALALKLASSRPWIVSGLELGNGTGLNAEITAGLCWIDGYVVVLDASEAAACTASETNHIWLELAVDGNDLVTGLNIVVNTTDTEPTGPFVKLGTAVTDGSAVTSTPTTGRSSEEQVEPVPQTAADISFDNSASSLTATDVQAAVEELAARPASGGWTGLAAKTSDTARSSDNTATDDPELKFTAEANKTYLVKVEYYASFGAGDFRIDFSGPAGASGTYNYGQLTNNSSFSNGLTLAGNSIAIGTESGLNIPGTALMGHATAIITTDETAGDICFQWGQNTSQPAATTVVLGSLIMWKDITPPP